MTITLTFSSVEEMLAFCEGVAAKSRSVPSMEPIPSSKPLPVTVVVPESKPRMYRKTGLLPGKEPGTLGSPGESLRYWRRVNNLTQGDAGQLFGYTCHFINGTLACAAISHIERGKVELPRDRVRNVIEQFTGIPADSWTKEA